MAGLKYESLTVPVVLRHDELVKVDEREVLHAKHVAVEAVVERREESLRADLGLRRHIQLPLEDGELDTFGRGVIWYLILFSLVWLR